ncbi:MAG: polyphosphate polymerase domain-containing protein [Candidatus Nanopelagicales bacterium]
MSSFVHLSDRQFADMESSEALGDGCTDRALAGLPAIDVATLSAQAGLMTRVDRKYLVDRGLLPVVLDWLPPDVRVLEIAGRRAFDYRSVYFDTPTLTSYLLAARRRPRRWKVRTRSYLDSGTHWLEVKTRDGRGRTQKSRVPWSQADAERIVGDGADFVAASLVGTVADPEAVVSELAAVLSTRYRRITLQLPSQSARVTVDVGLRAADHTGKGLVVPSLMVVETKTSGPACAADRALWSMGQRPIKVSKYATCLAAMHPALTATKWRPALRRLAAE